MNTFTAQELADFYQKVADGGEIEYQSTNDLWSHKDIGPNLLGSLDNWRIKPTKKVIDLSVLIASQIDCEFKDLDTDSWIIGKLHDLPADHDGCFKFWKRQDNSGCWYDKCRPRMNHKHAWDGGDCPIEGFVVRVWFDKEDFATVDTSFNIVNWNSVIWVEFLELEDGYVMPYDKEDK